MTYGNDVEEWSRALLERFGPTKASGMAIIVRERYSLGDAMRHREPREYAMTIIRAAKIAKLGDVHNQLDIIWNGLDVEFQSDIDLPTAQITLNQFLTSLDLRKQQWWTKASRMGKSNTSSMNTTSRPPQARGNLSQYTNQARSMPFRSMNSGSQSSGFPQNSGFQSMNRPQASASPYQQNYQAYNQYQNRSYGSSSTAYQGHQRKDQPALPAPPVQRQITAGPNQNYQSANAYGSRQPFQPNSYRPPFQPSSYRPPS